MWCNKSHRRTLYKNRYHVNDIIIIKGNVIIPIMVVNKVALSPIIYYNIGFYARFLTISISHTRSFETMIVAIGNCSKCHNRLLRNVRVNEQS